MRKLRLLSIALVLALAFATTGFAGITPTVPEQPPPPSEPVTATGIIECPPSPQAANNETDSVIDLAQIVLQSVLLVF